MAGRVPVTREQILAFRQRSSSLGERLPRKRESLRRAAWAGLTDSMPRAALLSLHARVADVGPDDWEAPSLVQVWGPRFSAYVVAEPDVAVFTRARLPAGGAKRKRADDLADRLADLLGDGRMQYGEAGRALGVNPNMLRYAAPTGRVLIRWDGARQPEIWMAPEPEMEPEAARRELALRYLQVLGPGTAESFGKWAGFRAPAADAAFESLAASLTPVDTPIRGAFVLAEDEETLRGDPGPVAPARLLPSGDVYYLLWGADRDLLVPDPDRRDALWTSRVWPGAVMVAGELVGVWRRSQHKVTVEPWRRVSRGEREAVEAEAASLPLPGLDREIEVTWDD